MGRNEYNLLLFTYEVWKSHIFNVLSYDRGRKISHKKKKQNEFVIQFYNHGQRERLMDLWELVSTAQ